MKKLLIEEKFKKARQVLEEKRVMQLEMGTDEYASVLERIINDLKNVKSSLRTRSKEGAVHRKEASRIQAAINAMKYLSNKSSRMLSSATLKEEKKSNEALTREDVKNFLKTFK